MTPEVFFFDLGNVLLFFSHAKMWRNLGQVTGLTPKQLQELNLMNRIWMQYEEGLLTTEEVLQEIKRKIPVEIEDTIILNAIADIFIPNLPVLALLENLKKQGFGLILISNTSEAHFDFALRHYPVIEQFDHHVLSYKEKSMKPSPKIYEKALSLSKKPSESCMYIDDVPRFIHQAQSMGILGHIFTTAPSLNKQLLTLGVSL